jgi:hypothetical protein
MDLTGTAQWICLTRTRISHETLHRCGALRNDTVVRIGDHTDKQLTSQPTRTCAAWLSCLRDGSCRLPWVPTNWRTLLGPSVTM